jgi:GntR family transcriptional regulator / MocR family aminotransferase
MRAAIVIDPKSATPIHRQIYESWREGILRGRFAHETRVPSTRELAKTLGVARSTVTQAYEQLIAEGYLQTARGSGTFVCRVLPESLLRATRSTAKSKRAAPEFRLSNYGARLTDDFEYPRKQPGYISFSHWWPDQSLFPSVTWRRLMFKHLRQSNPELFNYARHAQGYEPLRKQIAQYVARYRAAACTAEQVIVVNGSQQGLDLFARVVINSGDEVAVEDPGYIGARRVFLANGAQLNPVPVDEQGIVCDRLRVGARVVYVTPSHQFPTGVAMSLSRRLQLIAWAREHRAMIVEDDYDSEYRYSGAPLPSLQGLSPDAPVIYCGTFSKVMFPGLRVGFMIVPPSLISAFRRAKWLADRNTPLLEQAALADFLGHGHLERHIRRMRRLYGSRRQALVESLAKHFGGRAQVVGDEAGMHALVRIADAGIVERAMRNKVQLRATADYYMGHAPRNEYVFGFATLSERAIREGIRRIAP